jgi:hypothetical protein
VCQHAFMHTYIHVQLFAQMHSLTRNHWDMQHAHMHVHTGTRNHTNARKFLCTHAHTHAHARACKQEPTQAQHNTHNTHPHTHVQTHVRTQREPHMSMPTHAHSVQTCMHASASASTLLCCRYVIVALPYSCMCTSDGRARGILCSNLAPMTLPGPSYAHPLILELILDPFHGWPAIH